MEVTLKELAGIIGGEIAGDGTVLISGVAGIKEAREGDITFLANPRYDKFLKTTEASAVIGPPGTKCPNKPLVVSENPYLSFVKAVEFFVPNKNNYPREIHPAAVIAPGAVIGDGVAVGACAVIEDGARIGDDTVILAGTYVGRDTVIGKSCLVYPSVTIREEVRIGDRVIIHSGAVIGGVGSNIGGGSDRRILIIADNDIHSINGGVRGSVGDGIGDRRSPYIKGRRAYLTRTAARGGPGQPQRG